MPRAGPSGARRCSMAGRAFTDLWLALQQSAANPLWLTGGGVSVIDAVAPWWSCSLAGMPRGSIRSGGWSPTPTCSLRGKLTEACPIRFRRRRGSRRTALPSRSMCSRRVPACGPPPSSRPRPWFFALALTIRLSAPGIRPVARTGEVGRLHVRPRQILVAVLALLLPFCLPLETCGCRHSGSRA